MTVADVLIVGAGAGGAVAARSLQDAGLAVVCLEQGDWVDPAAYPGDRPEWELLARGRWSSDPDLRGGPGDYSIDSRQADIRPGLFNGVGGGTILYNAVWPRLLPSDFRARSEDGVADDWPLDYAELAPFYERTDAMFGVSGLAGNPAYPEGPGPVCPPLPIGTAGRRLAAAHRRLGWHWWPDNNAILSTPRDDRGACVQRGTCATGCGERAKASVDVTHWRRFCRRGGELVTGARVRRVLLDAAGLARGVEWVDRDGHDHETAANLVLLAANAIGTARILLDSSSPSFPDGLANSSGLVGRRLMLHPMALVDGVFDAPFDSWQGHNGSAIQSLEFYRTDESRGFLRGAKWSLHPTGGPLAAALADDAGPDVHRRVADRLGRTARWCILCEDLPENDNRVRLSGAAQGDGTSGVALHYRLSENSRRLRAWQVERATESLSAAGAARVSPILSQNNAHLMGTARMGDDPGSSVVNRWGMCHDVPNLGVVDGSVFVTSGAVNPTSTIAALSLRAAEHLIERWDEVARPRHRSTPRTRPSGASGLPRSETVAPTAPPRLTEVAVLDAAHRSAFVQLADLLLPAAGTMPAASEVDVGGALVDQVLSARPDLTAVVLDLAADGPPRSLADLEALRTQQPQRYLALLTAVCGAYYLSPRIRQLLGYPGQEARPFTVPDVPAYVADGLLDHLFA